ncbi:MAG: hypothetical protein WCG04_03155 [Alphaproteobacteria bacterium]
MKDSWIAAATLWPRNDGSGVITSSPSSLRGVYDEAIQDLLRDDLNSYVFCN